MLVLVAEIVISAVASVLGYLVNAGELDRQLDQLRTYQQNGQEIPPAVSSTIDSFANALVVAILVVSLVIVVVEIVMLVFMWRRRNWARIVLTVFVGIGLLGFLTGIGQVIRNFSAGATGAIGSVLQIVAAVLLVVGIVVMYRPNANAWFRSRPVQG